MLPASQVVARDNARFRASRLQNLPLHVTRSLERTSEEIERAPSPDEHPAYRHANKFIAQRTRALTDAKTHIAFDEDEIQSRAEHAAQLCRHIRDLDKLIEFCESQGINVPRGKHVTKKGIRARFQEASWWRRRYRAKYGRAAENAMRSIGLVHRHADPYVTADGLQRFSNQQRRNVRWLQSTQVLDPATGELIDLDQIAKKAVSNPAIRRAELMTRVAGFERLAAELGHTWVHITLTAPSAFHAYLRTGQVNPQWIGTTTDRGSVGDARAWMQQSWARARAAIKRARIVIYGLRTAEPHHDATPHWHALIFGSSADLEIAEHIVRRYWLSEYGEEAGAAEHRVSVIKADARAGSAAGYIAKYISKGTSGASLDSDDAEESDLDGTSACARVVAWARIHGIRQFQQISGPSVTLWRELRRIREQTAAAPLEAARQAADAGQWDRFITAIGGIERCRRESPVMLDKDAPREIDSCGRRVIKLNAYGELPPDRIVGLKCIWRDRWHRAATHQICWQRVRKVRSIRVGVFSDLGPVEITVRPAPGGNEPTGWVNPSETSMYGPAI